MGELGQVRRLWRGDWPGVGISRAGYQSYFYGAQYLSGVLPVYQDFYRLGEGDADLGLEDFLEKDGYFWWSGRNRWPGIACTGFAVRILTDNDYDLPRIVQIRDSEISMKHG